MNWVDLVVLAVIALSGLLALMRGLVREVLGLGAWVIAGLVASSYGLYPAVFPYVSQQFADPTTAAIVAFGSVFVIVLVSLWIVAGLVAGAVRGSVLGGLDRTLGLLFGLIRGAALVCVAYILVGMAIPPEQWPPLVVQARSLPLVYQGAEWIKNQVPPPYRPAVAPPPNGRPTDSASLLQSTPTGRALGARPARD